MCMQFHTKKFINLSFTLIICINLKGTMLITVQISMYINTTFGNTVAKLNEIQFVYVLETLDISKSAV